MSKYILHYLVMNNLNDQNGRVKILGSQEKNQFDLYDKIIVSPNADGKVPKINSTINI